MASLYVAAGSSLLGAVGHLANLGQFGEMAQSHTYQKENMRYARAALQQDAMALRLDLLAALKEDIRDHYTNHTAQVDTLLVVTTLLFTFGLATLQFSDPFVLKTEAECPDCLEVQYPWLAYVWVFLVASVLVFPFWSLVMALWCKIQLDRWLGSVSKKLNVELRWALRERTQLQANAAFAADEAWQKSEDSRDRAESEMSEDLTRQVSTDTTSTRSRSLLSRITGRTERSEQRRHTDPGPAPASPYLASAHSMLNDPAAFVDEYQDQFEELWVDECAWLIETSTCIVWFSATFAALLTALMFGTFLANRHHQQNGVSALFGTLMTIGFIGPGIGMMRFRCRRRAERGDEASPRPTRRPSISEQRRMPLLRSAAERRSVLSARSGDSAAEAAQPEVVRSVTEPVRRTAFGVGTPQRTVRYDLEQ